MKLSSLFDMPNTKIAAASAAQTPPTPRAGNNQSAVQAAVKVASEEARARGASTASHAPLEDLEKIAREVAARDHQGTLKEAHLYGQAICDGFMSQLAIYEKVAAEQVERTDKVAAQAGADAAEMVRGQIHTVASNHYLGGYEMAKALVQ